MCSLSSENRGEVLIYNLIKTTIFHWAQAVSTRYIDRSHVVITSLGIISLLSLGDIQYVVNSPFPLPFFVFLFPLLLIFPSEV